MDVRTSDVDSPTGECEIVSSTAQISFPFCENAETLTVDVQSAVSCPADWIYEAAVRPAQASLYVCQAQSFEAVLQGQSADGSQSFPPTPVGALWESDDARLVVTPGAFFSVATAQAVAPAPFAINLLATVNQTEPVLTGVSHVTLLEPDITIEAVDGRSLEPLALTAGETVQLRVVLPPQFGYELALEVWSTRDPDIAAIDAFSGMVTGLSPGTTVADVELTYATGGCQHTVRASVPVALRPVEIASVEVTPAHVTFVVGQRTNVLVTARTADGVPVSLDAYVPVLTPSTPDIVELALEPIFPVRRWVVSVTGAAAGEVDVGIMVAQQGSEGDAVHTSFRVTVHDIVAIDVRSSEALLRNDGSELTLSWEFLDSGGNPVLPPEGTSATLTAFPPDIVTLEHQELQRASVSGISPGQATITVRALDLMGTATIDVFEEGVYRFEESTITTTGVSRGEVLRCTGPDSCVWVPFSCTFAVDTTFDPASAVRVVTRPLDHARNRTSVVLDGGLAGGAPLQLIIYEVPRVLSQEGPDCLAGTARENAIVPFVFQTTAVGEQVYPFSETGVIWLTGASSHTSWIGGAEGSLEDFTPVRFLWPVTVT